MCFLDRNNTDVTFLTSNLTSTSTARDGKVGALSEGPIVGSLHVLLQPGHYDILYPKSESAVRQLVDRLHRQKANSEEIRVTERGDGNKDVNGMEFDDQMEVYQDDERDQAGTNIAAEGQLPEDILLPDESLASDILLPDESLASDILLPDESLASDSLLPDESLASDIQQRMAGCGVTVSAAVVRELAKRCSSVDGSIDYYWDHQDQVALWEKVASVNDPAFEDRLENRLENRTENRAEIIGSQAIVRSTGKPVPLTRTNEFVANLVLTSF